MAELPRTHPLESRAGLLDRLPDCVTVTVEPFTAMTGVRVAAAGFPRAGAPGLTLPATPSTWVPAGSGRAIWLGPDEWLLTSTTERPRDLEARLRAATAPFGGTATDVSAQRITLRLTGIRTRAVLAKGCALDLHPRSFRRGDSAQTMLGQAGVILLALADDGGDYAVLVRSSLAGYLADWLADAALEFTAAPGG
jgi:sarcosine oxidase subunit gamma